MQNIIMRIIDRYEKEFGRDPLSNTLLLVDLSTLFFTCRFSDERGNKNPSFTVKPLVKSISPLFDKQPLNIRAISTPTLSQQDIVTIFSSRRNCFAFVNDDETT